MRDLLVQFAHLSDCTPTCGDVYARCTWTAANPLVVAITFDDVVDPETGEPLHEPWLIARDLLSNGGGDTTPAGQVVVWRSTLWIGLAIRGRRSPTTFAVLYGDTLQLDTWLSATYREVAAGDEVTEQAIDAFIDSCGVTP